MSFILARTGGTLLTIRGVVMHPNFDDDMIPLTDRGFSNV